MATLVVAVVMFVAGAATTTSAAAGQPREFKVGVVLTGGIRGPFERVVYRGLARAVRELGVQGRVLVAGPREGSIPSFAYFARRGYNLVIAGSALQVDDVNIVAREYPKVRFLMVDASIDELADRRSNVQGTVFNVEEGTYLAGYLAALTERSRPGRDVVSSVGGAKAPQVDRFIAGFQAGARKATPKIRTLNAYANKNFFDPTKCRSIALRQIARGSGVVLQVAGLCGLGALAAARDKGRFGVGVDVDQSALGPHVLTSVLKRLDLVVFRAVSALRRGHFRTGINRAYGIRNGGVALGRISSRVPARLVVKLERLRRQLVTGELPPIPTAVRPSVR